MTAAMTPSHLPWFMRPLWPVFKRVMMADDDGASARKASRSSVFAAVDPSLERVSGRYLDPKSREHPFHKSVRDQESQRKVMQGVFVVSEH